MVRGACVLLLVSVALLPQFGCGDESEPEPAVDSGQDATVADATVSDGALPGSDGGTDASDIDSGEFDASVADGGPGVDGAEPDGAESDGSASEDAGETDSSVADAMSSDADTDDAPPVITNVVLDPMPARVGGGPIVMTATVSDDVALVRVTADLSSIGLAAATAMLDDGQAPDQASGDGVYTVAFSLGGAGVQPGLYRVSVTAEDSVAQTTARAADLEIIPNAPEWRPVWLPMADANAVYDPVGARVVLWGGHQDWGSSGDHAFDETWAWTSTRGLSRLSVDGSRPPPRAWDAYAHDSLRNRLIVFGGLDARNRLDLNDVWALDLASGQEQWSQIIPIGTPPSARDGQCAFYDADDDRVIVFGGMSEGYFDDLWALDLSPGAETWTQLTPLGVPPTAVWAPACAANTAGTQAIIFGGYDGNAELAQTFALDLTLGAEEWTDLEVLGPPTRDESLMVYLPNTDRYLMFGGYLTGDVWGDDLWVLNGNPASASWSQVNASGPRPSGRVLPAGVALPDGRVWVFGGSVPGGPDYGDAWTFAFTGDAVGAWTMQSTHLGARHSAFVELTPVDRTLLVYGGDGTEAGGVGGSAALNDLFAMAVGEGVVWNQIISSDPSPGARSLGASAYDSLRGQWYIGAGHNSDVILSDVWRLGSPASAGQWTQMGWSMSRPGVAVYDAANDRIIVDGALAVDLATQTSYQLNAIGTPPTVSWGTSAIYDRWNARMVVYDGELLFALDLTRGAESWSALAPTGTPPVGQAWAVTTEARSASPAMYVLGSAAGGQTALDTLFRLDLTEGSEAWSTIATTGVVPLELVLEPGFVHDAVGNRLLVLGGDHPFNDLPLTGLWEIAYLEEGTAPRSTRRR